MGEAMSKASKIILCFCVGYLLGFAYSAYLSVSHSGEFDLFRSIGGGVVPGLLGLAIGFAISMRPKIPK